MQHLDCDSMTHYGRQASAVHGGEARWSAHTLYVIILSGLVILLIDSHREQADALTLCFGLLIGW